MLLRLLHHVHVVITIANMPKNKTLSEDIEYVFLHIDFKIVQDI